MIAADSAEPEPHLNRLLKRQLRDARAGSDTLDVDALLRIISEQYDRIDEERRGIVRSMQLMSDEAQALTREIREQSAAQLQAILDNVKDAIITVDEQGHVETFNPTGERMFGYDAHEVIGRDLEMLVPEIAVRGGATKFLTELAARIDDTHMDLAAHEISASSRRGRFAAELTVSKAHLNQRPGFVVCIRDTAERHLAEQTMRESEARYRTLVENAPEAIVVLDVDRKLFADANEHACRFFKMERRELLACGPEKVSPRIQADGSESFGKARGFIEGALNGATPVFEWLHCDATGREIPCEVRLARLPSVNRRLIRGSITDISERKRAEAVAAAERRVLEKIAVHAPLDEALEHVARGVESVIASGLCAISLFDRESSSLRFGAAPSLARKFVAAMDHCPVGVGVGSCAAAVYLARTVMVANIESDAFWEHRREAAAAAKIRAAWSSPILQSDGSIVGTIALYRRESGLPSNRDQDLVLRLGQLAGIAIERHGAAAAVRDSEAKFRGLFQSVMEAVFQTTLDGKFLAVNRAFVEMLGYDSAEEVYELNALGLYSSAADREAILRGLESSGEVRNLEVSLARKDGSAIVVLESCRAVRDLSGRMIGIEGTFVDITERKRAETQVFQEKERAQVTLESIGDAVITTDSEALIDYMNPVAESLTGWENRTAQRRKISEVLATIHEIKRQPIENPIEHCLREGRAVEFGDNALLISRRGQEIAIQTSAAPIRDRTGHLIGAVMVFRDASKERRLHRALYYQASHDALTGLINRREFEHRLTAAVENIRQHPGARHALLYLDLDQFKLVNDTCGHPAGDSLLKKITGVLQSRIRAGDTLARLGGDEFGILLEQCSLDQALRIAESLRQAVHDFRFNWLDKTLTVGVSIGIVEMTPDTPTVSSVMSAADVACYSAKDEGRDRVSLYKPDEVPERHREMHWVSKLTRACDEDGFELFFQPIVAIGSNPNEREHFELTLRLRDEGAFADPAEFIPAAERYNVMPAIDRWVVRRAIEQIAHVPQRGLKPFTTAVNLSGTSLNDDRFLEFLIVEIERAPVSRGALCFEITETAAISNLTNAVFFMNELKSRGCLFALDDFGSGLASFMYLKRLPVDYLKIDGQFIENVASDRVDRSMVEAISQVGKVMGIYTIAERVESREVMTALGKLGISFAQGFYMGEPLPIAQFPYLRLRDNLRNEETLVLTA